jgi:hypothetical protein
LNVARFDIRSSLPEFRCNPQIFAAAHQSVGLATFGSCCKITDIKIVLFSTSSADEATSANQCILSRNVLGGERVFASWREAPAYEVRVATHSVMVYAPAEEIIVARDKEFLTTRSKSLIQDPSVFNLRKVEKTI